MNNPLNGTVLSLQNIERSFTQGNKTISVLRGVNLDIQSGELVGLVGASGSGKSTLLQIAGLLDKPTSGMVVIDGTEVSSANDDVRSQFRREKIGFVYQFHHLLPEFTAQENVALAAQIGGATDRQAREKAKSLLDSLGLIERLDHIPAKLSGGEQQRVAIARALAGDPKIILADEPTGNLDEDTAKRVFELLLETAKSFGVATFLATHDKALAQKLDRQLFLKEGQLQP
jgi:lipoprotein-releasing system ATP-binding protein